MTRRATAYATAGVLAGAWGLLPRVGLPPFSAHMLMHMAVVAVAAPLLALTIADTRFDPVRRSPSWCSPLVASMVELVAVWAWHAPVLHHAARHHGWAQALEQGSFLASGLYLWIAAVGGDPRQRRERAPAAITGLLLTSMHMTLLGALLVLTPRSLFGHHGHGAGPAWLSPEHDQQLGGAIMLIVGGFVYLAGGLWRTQQALSTSPLLGERASEARP